MPVQETSYRFCGYSPKSILLLDPIQKAFEELTKDKEGAETSDCEKNDIQGRSTSRKHRKIHSKVLGRKRSHLQQVCFQGFQDRDSYPKFYGYNTH